MYNINFIESGKLPGWLARGSGRKCIGRSGTKSSVVGHIHGHKSGYKVRIFVSQADPHQGTSTREEALRSQVDEMTGLVSTNIC